MWRKHGSSKPEGSGCRPRPRSQNSSPLPCPGLAFVICPVMISTSPPGTDISGFMDGRTITECVGMRVPRARLPGDSMDHWRWFPWKCQLLYEGDSCPGPREGSAEKRSVTRDMRGYGRRWEGDMMAGRQVYEASLSHQWQKPAKLLLVDSDDVGNGVEVLFSQHLFWQLWQHHSISHGGQERMGLGRGQSIVWASPSSSHTRIPVTTCRSSQPACAPGWWPHAQG